jgi:hypothetical protein
MARTNYQIEWHFSEENEADAAQWPPLADTEANHAQQTMQPRQLYVYVVALTLIAGIVLYWIRQQTEHRIAIIEEELVVLQRQLAQPQPQQPTVTDDHRETTAAVADTAILPHRFETEYLRFETSAHMVESAKAVAARVNATYRELHQTFGLESTMPIDKLTVMVDSASPQGQRSGAVLVVPEREAAAARHGTTEADALTHAITGELVGYTLNKALQGRVIKPQWHTMLLALQRYLQREHGPNQYWQRQPEYLLRRHLAQTRSIDLAQQIEDETQTPSEIWLFHPPTADELADPLVEFILESYGYGQVPSLLDAFEEHESWETLAPAVFNLSADQFEDAWHTYLKAKYPIQESYNRW